MTGTSRSNVRLLVAALLLVLPASGCLFGGKKKNNGPSTNSSVEPDKVLFDRAMDDIKHSRYTIARLSLQTLINTYPDSEYLAKAKLALADSYYKEGGTSGFTQAVSEYKDFETFFPFLDEAAYAQMQIGMAHYQMMEKPDRDRTQAEQAEDEFQTFILKFQQNPLLPQAEQRLRDVQEVVAEGDFRVAHFYYVRDTPSSYRAAAARLIELTDRYPLYSQSDRALWMLGDIYGGQGRNEDEKARFREVASRYYQRIVRDYPLSPLVADAKQKLIAGGFPVPQADPAALARMQQEQQAPHVRRSIFRTPMGMLKSNPDVSMAAHSGQPNLNPPSDTGGSEVLRQGGVSSVGGGGGGGGGSVAVETVPAGSESAPGTGTNAPAASNPPAATAPATDPKPATTPPSPIDPHKKASDKNSKDSKDKDKNESSSKKKKGLRKLIPW